MEITCLTKKEGKIIRMSDFESKLILNHPYSAERRRKVVTNKG